VADYVYKTQLRRR